MEPELKRYIHHFLSRLSETLDCSELNAQAESDLGIGKRYQLTDTLNLSSWSEEDIRRFSAAYFEALAYAGEQLATVENADQFYIKFQDHLTLKVVPALVVDTPDDKRFEVIKNRIKNEGERLELSDYSWGFWASAAAVGVTVAAVAGVVTGTSWKQ